MPEGAAGENVGEGAAGSDASLVVNDLDLAIVGDVLDGPRYPGDVGGGLDLADGVEDGLLLEAVVPGRGESDMFLNIRGEATLTSSSKSHHNTRSTSWG